MSNVVQFPGPQFHDIEPDKVLEAAMGKMSQVVICGWDKDNNMYFACSEADGGSALWHLTRAQHRLMQIVDEMEAGE